MIPLYARLLRSPGSLHFALACVGSLLGAAPLRAQLAIYNTDLSIAVMGAAYPSTYVLVANGTSPYSYSISSGRLPAGMALGATTGQLSGTPTETGSFPVTFRVSDAVGAVATKSLTLISSDPPDIPDWQPRGVYGGAITRMLVSPGYLADQTLFALGREAELFISADRGANWNTTVVIPAAAALRLDQVALSPDYNHASAAPASARSIFLSGPDAGVFVSAQHGAPGSFVPSGAGLPCSPSNSCSGAPPGFGSLAISPDFPNDGTLWITVHPAAGSAHQVYRSQNGGASWLLVGSIPEEGVARAEALVAAPNYALSGTLLAGVNKKIYRSTDRGASWSLLYDSNFCGSCSNELGGIVYSPDYATDGVIVAYWSTGQTFKSSDYGLTWVRIATDTNDTNGTSIQAVHRAGQPPVWYLVGYNYIGNHYLLRRSTDYLVTAVPLFTEGATVFNGSLAASPQLAGGGVALFYGLPSGIYSSQDEGFFFSARQNGLQASQALSLAGAGSTVIAGGVGGWFKSGDGGLGWVRLTNRAGTNNVAAVSPNYAADRTLFVGDSFGYMPRSIDGGRSFSGGLYLSFDSVRQTAFYPGFTGSSGRMLAGTARSGLQRSVDGGASFSTWIISDANCPLSYSTAIDGLAVSPSEASDRTLFVSTPYAGATGGLCRSTDDGATWTPLTVAGIRRSGTVALPPGYNQAGANGPARTLLLLSGGSAYRSTDGGAAWSVIATPGAVYGTPVFSPNFAADATVFIASGLSYGVPDSPPPAGSFTGVLRSGDGGATFAAPGAGDELGTRRVTALLPLPGFNGNSTVNSVILAATDGSGLWRSTDGGRTFHPIGAGRTGGANVTALTRVPFTATQVGGIKPGDFFMGTSDEGIFYSGDGGISFSPLSGGTPAGSAVNALLSTHGQSHKPLAALSGAGLWRFDGSQTWAALAGYATGDYTRLTEFPRAAGGYRIYAVRADGVSLRSDDDGATWTPLSASRLTSADLDDAAPLVPFAAPKFPAAHPTASLWSASQSEGASYSTDAGSNWIDALGSNDYTLPSGGNYQIVKPLGLNAQSGGREVLIGSRSGLFLSRDGGDAWRRVDGPGSGLEATSKNFKAVLSTQTLYGTTDVLVGANGAQNGGVYLSGDGGEHWTQINQGFDPGNLSIASLVKSSCNGCPVQYYSGTYGSGIYTRTIAVNPPPQFPAVNFACAGAACACGVGSFGGPVSGGTPVTLCGSGFRSGVVVEFDGVAASGCASNLPAGGTQITCAGTPPHAAGAAAVRARNPDTRSGALPGNYQYLGGASRASGLRVAKSGPDAALTWSCPSCGAGNPAQVYRAQNAALSLYLENYNGGAGGAYTNTGAVASAQSYFWTVE